MNKIESRVVRRLRAVVALSIVMSLLAVGAQQAAAVKNSPAPQSGADVPTVPAALPSGVLQGGSWSSVIQMKDVPVHLSLLPDGRLLYWGRDKAVAGQGDNRVDPNCVGTNCAVKYPYDGWDVQFRSRTFLWNPLYAYDPNSGAATAFEPNATAQQDNTTTNLFCSGHTFLPDGTLLVAGGHQRHPDPAKPSLEGIGEDDLNTFDYRTNAWTLLPTHMQKGRWYPRGLTLADGRTLVLSGTYLPNPISNPSLNTTPEIFGLDGSLTQAAQDTNQPPSYITSTYPFISLAPDRRVYYAGAPDDRSARFFDPAANLWARTFADMDAHDTGTAVTYAAGRLLVLGGRHPVIVNDTLKYLASSRAQLMNLNLASGNSTPAWAEAQAMQNPRIQATASVLLPDGKVLAVGGTRCPGTNAIKYNLNGEDPDLPPCDNGQVLTPELWTPGDSNNPGGSWATMAPQQETRVYHSTALLMPDGRVLVSGGGLPAASGETASGVLCTGANESTVTCKHYGHKTAEVYSPPYLFEPDGVGAAKPALRPALTSAPASAAYGQQFYVGVGNVAPTTNDIAKVVLIRLPSITHGTDPDQRRIELSFQPAGDGYGLRVTAPPDGAACPPGPYMLFLVRNNGRGTPSFAKVIRLGDLSVNKTAQTFLSGLRSGDTNANGVVPGSVSVTAAPGVSWTATLSGDASPWLSITSGASGTGSGTVSLGAAVNNTGAWRGGTLTIKVVGRNYSAQQVQVAQAAEFGDVGTGNSLYPFIGKLYARQITGGCGAGQYCPNDYITRGQMAVFVTRSLGLTNLPTPQTPFFSDVQATHPFYKFIEAFGRLGITSGCGGGAFCPESNVTRGQMAVFIVRGLGINAPPAPANPTFTDVPASHPSYPYIEEMVRRGITSGCYNDGVTRRFCPDDNVTRGQMAVFLSTAFGF